MKKEQPHHTVKVLTGLYHRIYHFLGLLEPKLVQEQRGTTHIDGEIRLSTTHMYRRRRNKAITARITEAWNIGSKVEKDHFYGSLFTNSD